MHHSPGKFKFSINIGYICIAINIENTEEGQDDENDAGLFYQEKRMDFSKDWEKTLCTVVI